MYVLHHVLQHAALLVQHLVTYLVKFDGSIAVRALVYRLNALRCFSALELLAQTLLSTLNSPPATNVLSDASLGVAFCTILPAGHASHCGKCFCTALDVSSVGILENVC